MRVCGNCGRGVVSRAHGVLIKSFKCDLDMQWVAFDESCSQHKYDSELTSDRIEEPVIEEPIKKKSKSEVIDLGGIPESIRTETGTELQRDAEDTTSNSGEMEV